MDGLSVRIDRCSLALSLAVKFGLAAWAALALLGGPTGSAALAPPGKQSLEASSPVELAQTQKKKRVQVTRSQRESERKESAETASKASREQVAGKDADGASQPGAANEKSASGPDKGRVTAKAGPEAGKATGVGANTADGKTAPSHQPPEQAPEAKELVWSEAEIIAALEDCVQLLAPIAAHIEVSTPIRSGQCGAPAAVVLKRIGASTPVEVRPPAVVNCRMVARLHEWVEATLQPAARELLKAPVTRMVNASGYACRNRNGSSLDKISEHAFANALDISAWVTADGRTIDVLSHWGQTARDLRAIALAKAEAEKQAKAEAAAAKAAEKAKGQALTKDSRVLPASTASKVKDGGKGPPSEPEPRHEPEPQRKHTKGKKGSETLASAERSHLGSGNPRTLTDARPRDAAGVTTEGLFLRRLHKGACGPFSTVLGPEANEAHRNHFHFDLAERRRRAFCE